MALKDWQESKATEESKSAGYVYTYINKRNGSKLQMIEPDSIWTKFQISIHVPGNRFSKVLKSTKTKHLAIKYIKSYMKTH